MLLRTAIVDDLLLLYACLFGYSDQFALHYWTLCVLKFETELYFFFFHFESFSESDRELNNNIIRHDFIQKLIAHEGLRLEVYKDSLGIDTIGIGRNLEDRGITKEELDWMDIPNMAIVHTMGITEADAMYLAENDVQIVEEELVRAHPCVNKLDAVRQLVVMDMAFNMGVPRLCKFKNMWNAIHEENYIAAAKEMLDSRWAIQVKSRSTKLANAMHNGEF